eukprot:m.563229 g.563229  ORF g.563229 m.563229 type:complete len:129 (-) comp57811_c0_seq6:2730-3116(-)
MTARLDRRLPACSPCHASQNSPATTIHLSSTSSFCPLSNLLELLAFISVKRMPRIEETRIHPESLHPTPDQTLDYKRTDSQQILKCWLDPQLPQEDPSAHLLQMRSFSPLNNRFGQHLSHATIPHIRQ